MRMTLTIIREATNDTDQEEERKTAEAAVLLLGGPLSEYSDRFEIGCAYIARWGERPI